MSSRGCIYTAQGSLLCGKQLETFEEENVEQVQEGYYEEEQPVYQTQEGYYEEEEQPVHEGYYEEEDQPLQEGYYNSPSQYNPMQQIYNAGTGIVNNATQMFRREKYEEEEPLQEGYYNVAQDVYNAGTGMLNNFTKRR